MKAHNKDVCMCCSCKSHRGEGIIWNKGLTKEMDVRVAKNGRSLSNRRKVKFWSNKPKIPKEVRYCTCGCGFSKQVKITNLWQYKSGHNNRNKILGSFESRFGAERANEMKKKMSLKKIGKSSSNKGKKLTYVTKRNLENNCMKNKEVRKRRNQTMLKKYGTLAPHTVPIETRYCKCGCGSSFTCKVNSAQKFTLKHGSRCRTDETKEKLGVCSRGKTYEERYGIVAASRLREQRSLSITKRIVSGKCWKSGYYFSKKNNKNFWYMSSYEQTAFQILESMVNVKRYNIQSVVVPYFFNNKKHNYIIDLYVEYINGEKQLIEVKPGYKLTDLQTQAKIEAGKLFAKENNMEFIVWTEKELSTIGGKTDGF